VKIGKITSFTKNNDVDKKMTNFGNEFQL